MKIKIINKQEIAKEIILKTNPGSKDFDIYEIVNIYRDDDEPTEYKAELGCYYDDEAETGCHIYYDLLKNIEIAPDSEKETTIINRLTNIEKKLNWKERKQNETAY
jgi:hypothetical protein